MRWRFGGRLLCAMMAPETRPQAAICQEKNPVKNIHMRIETLAAIPYNGSYFKTMSQGPATQIEGALMRITLPTIDPAAASTPAV